MGDESNMGGESNRSEGSNGQTNTTSSARSTKARLGELFFWTISPALSTRDEPLTPAAIDFHLTLIRQHRDQSKVTETG